MFEQLGLIGCGLMGGSFALALKRAALVGRVVGYSTSPATTEKARRMGVIDIDAPSALLAVSGADLVLVAVPVAASESTFKAIRHMVTPRMLVMDVGSTKRDVVEAAQRGLREHIGAFVPAHPVAGKELAGIDHADPNLYTGKQVILTPTAQTLPTQSNAAVNVWTALGSKVVKMTPEAHDAAFAAVSHLPHVLAFALMNAITNQPNATDFLSLAGPGFRDFTRIAASDPKIWRDIVLANRHEILAQSRALREQIDAFETAMHAGDTPALDALIVRASTARANWRMTEF